MSWNSKVHWTEGLFLRPHHFQQSDRYFEYSLASRTRHITPYPWGFSAIEFDRDIEAQGKLALRRASGILPDGGLFDFPANGRGPDPIPVPSDNAAGLIFWLSAPELASNVREVSPEPRDAAARFIGGPESVIDSTSQFRIVEDIEIAHLRLSYELRRTPRPGFVNIPIARILEVKDRTIIFDEKFAPPVLVTAADPKVEGWIDRVIGWTGAKLDELARFAANVTAGGGLDNNDYLMLQVLNRQAPALAHLRASGYVHPERLYYELLKYAGELATFSTDQRRAHEYPPYDHDNLYQTFEPVLFDIQEFLSAAADRRAVRLELIERGQNAYVSTIRDRSLYQYATFILEVAARRPLSEIQHSLPAFLKIGPSTKMNEIVHSSLPGVPLVYLPTPPPQLRQITEHVYFYLDRTSPLWPEFSNASALAMHFAGNWPDLELILWAVRENRR